MYENLPYLLQVVLMSLGLATGDAPQDVSDKAANPTSVVCEVKVETSGANKLITALASATDVKSGSFTLELAKTGNNSARTRQRGEFTLAAGETKQLAVTKLRLSSGDKLSGKLVLDWQGGKTGCDIAG